MSADKIRVFCDGLCEPRNPGGTATYGFAIYQGENRLTEGSGGVGMGRNMTNNVAEYTAAIRALERLLELGFSGAYITLLSDSQLLIRQLSGAWAVRSSRIRPLYRQASRLARKFKTRFRWIPREQNEGADALSVAAYLDAQEKNRRERA